MSIQTVNEVTGRYQISKGVTRNDLQKLASNSKTQSIQFASSLEDKEIELLEKEVFSKRHDITLRIYAHYSEKCDLSFIERIPSLRKLSADCLMEASNIETVIKLKNLDSLGVGIFNLDNFDFLEKINPNIKGLSLHETRSTKIKIECISRFTNLEHLYLERHQNGIESISHLKNLQTIVLRSVSTKNIDFLTKLEHLWSVDIKLGGIKNFDALTTLPKIKYLELWQVRGLGDLSFISSLPTLQNVFLQSLKQVQVLPHLDKNKSLRRIYIENLKGLKDLTALRTAPNLRELICALASNQEPENLIPALENPIIKNVLCGFGSDKKNNRFDELRRQYKKEEYKHSEFKYE
ncbi:MAG TPA: hypothetical protein VL443_09345 [Cyclobacteriaceae bacterium]|nr:hypothetical protein [Cyclobacteriaceae bacterium]